MGNCCGTQNREHKASTGETSPRAEGPKAESPRSPFDSGDPAENREHGTPEPAAERPAAPTRLLSPTSSVKSARSVYYDAEEGEPEPESRRASSDAGADIVDGAHDPEGKPSLWDMVSSALLPYRSMQRDESGKAPSGRLMGDADDKAKLGCLSLGGGTAPNQTEPLPDPTSRTSSDQPAFKPDFGKSVKKRASQHGTTASEDRSTDGIEVWEEADATSFLVRGQNYAKDGKKYLSKGSIYSNLLGVDIYSFEQKISHIAKRINLPKPPELGPGYHKLQGNERIPPILVVNVQLPTYVPSMWGATDGKGQSMVYYFSLPEGWEPQQLDNPTALALCQRFVHDGREHDKSPTRDRLKLIARVANVEEWAQKAPLSSTETRLITRYNDKPLLTRPQHAFYQGEDYMEIDLDVHAYAFIARRAFSGFTPRLSSVVFENAFVVQGNRPEELPELLLACARVSRVDFNKVRPFPGKLRKTLSHRNTIIMDQAPRSARGTHDEQQQQEAPEAKELNPKDSASSHAHELSAQQQA